MLTNTDCTVYRHTERGYERVYIPACFWQDSHSVGLSAGGLVPADEVLLYIPEEYASRAPKTPQKDILVRGRCAYSFNNSTASTVSESLRKLTSTFATVTVVSVANKLYGTAARHIKVVAR